MWAYRAATWANENASGHQVSLELYPQLKSNTLLVFIHFSDTIEWGTISSSPSILYMRSFPRRLHLQDSITPK